MRDLRKLAMLKRRIQSEPASVDTLREIAVTLVDEITWLAREVDDAKSIAQRASRNAMMGGWRR